MAAVAPQSLHRLVVVCSGKLAAPVTSADVARLHLARVQQTTAEQLKAGQSVVMHDGHIWQVQSVTQSPATPSSGSIQVAATAAEVPSSSPGNSSSPDKQEWILAPNQLPSASEDGDVPPLPVAVSAQDPNFHPVQVERTETRGDNIVLTCRNPETQQQEIIVGKQGRDNVFSLNGPDTADLSTSEIQNVEPGSLVATRDPQTGKTEFGRVVQTIQRQADALVTVRLADSKTGQAASALTCTPEHPFYVQGQGWVEAGSLAIGNSIVTRAGPPLVVQGVDWQRAKTGTKPYTVYNLTVEGDHTFFVGSASGGTWVHNVRGGCGLKVDPSATGTHMTQKTDAAGKVTHWAEWEPNPAAEKYPNAQPFSLARRADMEGGEHAGIRTPHTQFPKGSSPYPGDVRPATPSEEAWQPGDPSPSIVPYRM